MKRLKEGGKAYAARIDKALRRAAQRAEITAAATGTRLVIYEKGQIRRVRPPAKLNTVKIMREMQVGLTRHSKDYSHLELKKSLQAQKNLAIQRAEGEHTAVAENRAKYGSR